MDATTIGTLAGSFCFAFVAAGILAWRKVRGGAADSGAPRAHDAPGCAIVAEQVAYLHGREKAREGDELQRLADERLDAKLDKRITERERAARGADEFSEDIGPKPRRR